MQLLCLPRLTGLCRLQEEGRSVAAAPAGGDGWHEVGVVYRQNYTSGLGWLGWCDGRLALGEGAPPGSCLRILRLRSHCQITIARRPTTNSSTRSSSTDNHLHRGDAHWPVRHAFTRRSGQPLFFSKRTFALLVLYLAPFQIRSRRARDDDDDPAARRTRERVLIRVTGTTSPPLSLAHVGSHVHLGLFPGVQRALSV